MSGFPLDVEAHAIGSFRFDLDIAYGNSVLATATRILLKGAMNALNDVW